jgi:hypothetical protein
MGFAHYLSKALPRSWAAKVAPRWQYVQMLRRLRRQGGHFKWDHELKCWTATKVVGSRLMTFPVGSYRELRRIVTFDRVDRDIVFPWLEAITDCTMLYDFGPSSGLESLTANAHHGCEAVLVELFTPSMMSILRGTVLSGRQGYQSDRLHPMIAGGDSEPSFGRIMLHRPPVFGETFNSFQHAEDYGRGGRIADAVLAHQWAPSVSIDSLHLRLGFAPPTHVKIDVDGFERRILEGAVQTLEARHARSYSIEISPEHVDWTKDLMARHDYVVADTFEHYPLITDCWDYVFVRRDYQAEFGPRLRAAKAALADRVSQDKT